MHDAGRMIMDAEMNSLNTLKVKKLSDWAILPSRAYPGDAGLDLFAVEAAVLMPGERGAVPTGIALAIPVGFVGLVWDKSGLAAKRGIKTMGGVIDAGYRGEVRVILRNLGVEPHEIHRGDKIAQLLIQKIELPVIEEVTDLDGTPRGTGGFGSTGI